MLKAGHQNLPLSNGIVGCFLFIFLGACSLQIEDYASERLSAPPAEEDSPSGETAAPGEIAAPGEDLGPPPEVPSLSYASATGTSGIVTSPMSVAPSILADNRSAITSCQIKSGTTALPSWATIHSSTCVISGTPNALLAATEFTVIATNGIGDSADASVTLSATSLPLSVNAPSISLNIHSGQQYTFVPLRGIPPYTFTLSSGPGSLSAGGVFTAGTSAADSIVQIQDSTGESVNATVHHYYAPVAGGAILASAVDSAGNKYIGGNFTRAYAYNAQGALALNTTNGDPALEFDVQAGFNGEVIEMLRGPNGEIYVGGNFTTYKGVTVNRIVKLDQFGNLDSNFHAISGGFDDAVYALALNSAGTTLYVGGRFTAYRGVAYSARHIAKLSTNDGALDTTFHPNSGSTGGFNSGVQTLALDSTGTTLYAGGFFTSYRGVTNARYIAKLSTTNGTINTTFHPNTALGGFNAPVLTLALNSSGTTLYAGGQFTAYRTVTNSARFIAKLSTSNGAIDTTFHPVSATGGFDHNVLKILISPAETNLYIGGYFSSYRGVTNSARFVAKLSTTNGAIDTAFHPVSASGGFNGYVHALKLNSSGDALYVGGSFSSYRGVANSARTIAKLSTNNGAIDTAFHPVSASGGFDAYVLAFELNSTGTTLYVGGVFSSYRGVANSARSIAKLSASGGAIDSSFHPVSATGGFDSAVNALALNSNGTTLYVGGSFTTYRGVTNSALRIAKLSTSDGTIDTSFHPVSTTGGFDSAVYSLALDSTGANLYVGGNFTTYRGVANSARRIAKVSTSDGGIDTTFHPASATGGFEDVVNALTLNSDGSTLYVGGGFTIYRGVTNSAWSIAKLSTGDGGIDTTFHPVSATGGFDNAITSLVLNSDGTILYVGGHFTEYRGVANSAWSIAKVSTSDGTIDTSFHPVSASGGFNGTVWGLALNSTGTTLYVGGAFSSYRGVANSARSIAKVSTSDGGIDASFHPFSDSSGFQGAIEPYISYVSSLALNSTGTTLYVGGSFLQYEGEVCPLFGGLNATNGALVNP